MIDVPDRHGFADDDVEMFTECDIHGIEHPLDQMCHYCLSEKLRAERAKDITDGLLSEFPKIFGGK